MISRFYFWSIILLMITSNAWSKDIKRSKDTVTPTIKWIDANSSKITIPFKKNGKQAGKIVFDRDRDNDFTINCSLHYTDGHSVEIGNVGSGVISRIGILTFGKDANERILVISETGGTGMHDIYLNLVCPRYETCIGINMTFLIAATEFVPGISTTDNYNDKRLRVEKQYLEKLKYEYDFISEDEISKKQNDPGYAYYFWNKDNGKVVHGKLNIRKYKGKPVEFGSVEDTLVDGSVTYTAFFKAGVTAYDSKTDEHYVLFHPVSKYCWPTKLVKMGSRLIIETGGEGIAVINTKSFFLDRIADE